MRKLFTLISIATCSFGLLLGALPAYADLEDDYRDFPSDINLFDPNNPSGGGGNNGGGNTGGGGGGNGGGSSLDSFECSDGIDNDGDGAIDYPADSDCSSPFDDTESGSVESAIGGGTGGGSTITRQACADGLDNDGDGLIDFPNDPGCSGWLDEDETDEPAETDETPVLPSTGPADSLFLAMLIAAGVAYTIKSYKLQSN